MRLIDADALRNALYDADAITMRGVAIINQFPTIDAVPVVRCKDCVYYEEAKVNELGFIICRASGMEITDDDFCSYGERRSDD